MCIGTTFRLVLPTLLIVVLISLLSPGCAGESSHGTGAGAAIELVYWPAPNVQEIELADTVVKEWNVLHPSIHIRMQPIPVSQSTEEVLLAAIAGKTTPDVCSNIWPGALHEYTQAGGLVPLDRFPDFDSVAARTPHDLLETFRGEDGHYYQLPWKSNPAMMFYNKRLFRDAGVEKIPAAYSEYLAAGEKMKQRGEAWIGERDIRPIWWQRLFDFYPFYIGATNGGTLFHGGVPAFNNRQAEEVFAFFQACYANGYFPRTYFQGGDPFDLERKATHFAGPWEVAHLRKFAPHIDFGVASLPVPDGHRGPVYTAGDFKNIAIFSNSRHQAEAWEFVKFLVTNRHDLLLLRICDQIPIRADLLTDSLFGGYFRSNPLMVDFARQAPYTRGMDAVPDLKEIFDAISQEYEACAVYGKKTPAEAVSDAIRRTNLIVEWNR